MRNILTLVLGGGRGTRLYPLTKFRSKPAVPLAGKYRLIDIPLSNCINSGLKNIYVLTQFLSVSLHRHITQTYKFDRFDGGFVELLAAQQTYSKGSDWYEGTADAVRKNLRYLQEPGIEYVLILSGDQLYRMNFREMVATHQAAGADVSIAAMPVARSAASSLGIMRVDDSGKVVGFLEKPQTDKDVELVRTDPEWINARGIEAKGRDCLASMGIYLFNRDTLVDVLTKTEYQDFGREVFPAAIRSRHVQMHLFDGYWEDIGTVKSFYEANLALAGASPPFSLASASSPIYTRPRFLPPSRLDGVNVKNSLISDGCFIEPDVTIQNSVIGVRCRIGRGAEIRNSVICGADYYESDMHGPATANRPAIGIGRGTLVEGAIVDKNCRIGANCRVTNDLGAIETPDAEGAMVVDGIVCVQKDAVLPDQWRFAKGGARG
jgi:glucose-1-phosphate adenylyltransferase